MGSDQAREVPSNRSAPTSAWSSGHQFFQGGQLPGCQLEHAIPINHSIRSPVPTLTRRQWPRGEYLGSVEAPDRESAQAVAIKQFDLDQELRRRLLIRERD